jgi:ATP/maltotriose-dependent transcriptional regulator MalT/DNA-binding SARP family transcriptional activator
VLPQPCTVVFDNFQEMRATPEGRVAFAQGLEEIPEDVSLIFVSRTHPPPEFARLVASRRIARIDEAELRCTDEESGAILGTHVGQQELQRFQRQSDGWVAALVLLREHLSRRGATLAESLGESRDAIFQYFAGEIFNGAKKENQRILMLTAIPPSVTGSEAVALTGNDESPRLLEYLFRRHLFIDRRHGAETTYQYHALFREFLLEELRRRLPREEQQKAGAQAAKLLAGRGQVGEALAIFRDAGEWETMHSLIRTHALEWARQGRAQTLSDWIETLPAAMRENDPWLEYWFGRAWIFIQPQRGRPALERAFAAFRAAGDLRGQALALNTIVAGYYYEWANFAPLDRWLPEFDRLLGGERPAELDHASELRARAAWLIVLLLRRPEDENIERCAQRLDQLIDDEGDLNVRVMAASTLFNYINWKTEGESAAALVARIGPILGNPEVTPLMQVWWRTHLSFWHYINGRYGDSTVVMTEARVIAERFGLEAYLFEIDHAEVSALINKGEHAAAKARLEVMERHLSRTRRMHLPFFHHVRSVLAQRLGQSAAALEDAERAVLLARELSIPALQMPHFLARLAQARAATADRDGALRAIDEAIALASPFERRSFEERRELLEVEADIAAGETQRACAGLATVFAGYRERGQFIFMRSRPDLAGRFANFALEHGIEPGFVHTLIERNALPAPAEAGLAWPFRLRVRVLGGFELIRDGQPMRFTGKAQQRPLDLLKLLVALGGDNVDIQQLTAALWPDADGASAKTRSTRHCFACASWSTSTTRWCCRRASCRSRVRSRGPTRGRSRRRSSPLHAAARAGTVFRVATVARRLLEAYPGPLLGAEEHAWIAKPRDALHGALRARADAPGRTARGEARLEDAIDLYRRGLEADNLAEPFYRGLMRALAATGDQAEALNTFRRCRELLSIVLGIKPSAENRASASANHRRRHAGEAFVSRIRVNRLRRSSASAAARLHL